MYIFVPCTEKKNVRFPANTVTRLWFGSFWYRNTPTTSWIVYPNTRFPLKNVIISGWMLGQQIVLMDGWTPRFLMNPGKGCDVSGKAFGAFPSALSISVLCGWPIFFKHNCNLWIKSKGFSLSQATIPLESSTWIPQFPVLDGLSSRAQLQPFCSCNLDSFTRGMLIQLIEINRGSYSWLTGDVHLQKGGSPWQMLSEHPQSWKCHVPSWWLVWLMSKSFRDIVEWWVEPCKRIKPGLVCSLSFWLLCSITNH